MAGQIYGSKIAKVVYYVREITEILLFRGIRLIIFEEIGNWFWKFKWKMQEAIYIFVVESVYLDRGLVSDSIIGR